jgi:protein SCO1/2
MPAMSMSFGVKDVQLLEGLTRGDFVEATLMVTEDDAWLSTLRRVGHDEVDEKAEADEAASAPARPALELLEPGQEVPDERFTDQDGNAFSLAKVRGRAVALTFIYTRCPLPTFCPRMDRNFVEVQKRIAARPDLEGRVALITVSFDPTFDTPAVLRQHAASIGADLATWHFLTADEETIDRFATRFGVSVIQEADRTVTHNLRTAVLTPDGRVATIVSGSDWTVDQLIQDLTAALQS